jgi:hypothetical protein
MAQSRHQMTACRNRVLFQIDRAQNYIERVVPILPDDDADPDRQFLYQSTILMLHSFFEEYLRCIVGLGTFWKAEEVRIYLAKGDADPDRFRLMKVAELCHHAQERVRFEKKAVRLKAIVQIIAGRSPFADSEAELKCLDFAAVRNIIAHRGGQADSVCARIIKTPGVTVETGTVGKTKFYKLLIRPSFFAECLTAIARSVEALEEALSKEPAYSL